MKVIFGLVLVCAVAIALWFLFKPKPVVTNSSPRGETIICFGDSLTFGTGASQGKDYPSQLSELIKRPVINAGVPGDTTEQALVRLEQDVLARSPRIVCLTLGGNDLKNGVPKDEAMKNLTTIVRAIQAKGAVVIVGGIDVPLLGRGYEQGYEEVCQSTGAVLIPNVLKGLLGHSELMSDSIHPNDAGYGRMAKMFQEAMAPYL